MNKKTCEDIKSLLRKLNSRLYDRAADTDRSAAEEAEYIINNYSWKDVLRVLTIPSTGCGYKTSALLVYKKTGGCQAPNSFHEDEILPEYSWAVRSFDVGYNNLMYFVHLEAALQHMNSEASVGLACMVRLEKYTPHLTGKGK